MKNPDTHIRAIQTISTGLGELNELVVFVGGAVAELYATNPGASDIRVTLDVDCIIELRSKKLYAEFEENLRSKGFKHDKSKGAPLCRWIFQDLQVDIMTADEEILGFSNRWYKIGIRDKISYVFNGGVKIFILPPALYLATKIEALNNRGSQDLRQSSDFEDIIYILENCSEIVSSISSSEPQVKNYLKDEFKKILAMRDLPEAIECAMPFGSGKENLKNIQFKIGTISSLQ